MFLAFLASIMNGALLDGIVMWLPTYVRSTFNTNSAFSVFVSMTIPIMQMLGASDAGFAKKRIGNPFYSTTIFFLISFICLLFLSIAPNISLFLTCVMFALTAMMMTAVNIMLVSFIPLSMERYNCASVIAEIANAFVYIGSALESYEFGAISDMNGWNAVIFVLTIYSFAVFVICVLGGIVWHN